MPAVPKIALLIGVIALTLLALWPSVVALVEFWARDPYLGGHGPLIAAISLALMVRSRRALAAAETRPSATGAAALLVCGLIWLACWRTGIRELHLALLPVVLLLAVLAALGPAVARIAAFPLGFLYFAEPPWPGLITSLQALTIHAVGVATPILGMPVTITGSVLSFPGGISFEVTPLCSGVSFLVVGLAAAALIGELCQASLRRRAGMIAWMTLLMVVSNWLRVLLVIIAGYTSGMRSVLATRGHWYLGWVLFALVTLGFAWFATRRSGSTGTAGHNVPS